MISPSLSVKPRIEDRRRTPFAAAAFFDLFDRPVTPAEAARHAATCAAEALDGAGLATTDGMLHLSGRASTVDVRRERYVRSMRMFVRARRVTRCLSLLPSVRMVAVCNSLSLANAGEESDIDLFVVTAPGTAWVTRFVATSALAALRLRPDRRTHRNRVCLSFFVSEDGTDLRRVALADDPYLRHWILSLVPLYDAGAVMATFWARNRWAVGSASKPSSSRRFSVPARRPWKPLLSALRRLERPARLLQERLFPAQIRAIANTDTRVVTDERTLKFHVDDRRAAFARALAERLAYDAA